MFGHILEIAIVVRIETAHLMKKNYRIKENVAKTKGKCINHPLLYPVKFWL